MLGFGVAARLAEITIFMGLVIGLGYIWLATVTPSQLLFIKGLVKAKKRGLKKPKSLADYSSNSVFLAGYMAISLVFFGVYTLLLKQPLLNNICCFIIAATYPIMFANFLEYFKLSRYHQKKILFNTGLVISWVLVPIGGNILNAIFNFPTFVSIFNAFSPFIGPGVIFQVIIGEAKILTYPFIITAGVTLTLTYISIRLAQRERVRLRKQIFQ